MSWNYVSGHFLRCPGPDCCIRGSRSKADRISTGCFLILSSHSAPSSLSQMLLGIGRACSIGDLKVHLLRLSTKRITLLELLSYNPWSDSLRRCRLLLHPRIAQPRTVRCCRPPPPFNHLLPRYLVSCSTRAKCPSWIPLPRWPPFASFSLPPFHFSFAIADFPSRA